MKLNSKNRLWQRDTVANMNQNAGVSREPMKEISSL